MNYKTLQLKIIIIFSIPAIAIIYFSFSFINSKYKALNDSNNYIILAKYTNILSKFTHHIQIERGLSSGYIVAKNQETSKNKLLQQYKTTDEIYNNLLQYIKRNSKKEHPTLEVIHGKHIQNIKKILDKIHTLKQIRKTVLNSSISFEDEINYYTNINTLVLDSIHIFTTYLEKQTNDNNALIKLQKQKENAGLERAYIYNSLISNNYDDKRVKKIKKLILNQEIIKSEFKQFTSLNSMIIYSKFSDSSTQEKIIHFRNNFFQYKLNNSNAKEWFTLSSKYINELENISSSILLEYTKNANKTKNHAKSSLLITALLWSLSLISFIILTYTLKRLISKEEKMMDELRISAYTFDSHEAMTITDVNGTIIKVNQAFTNITGYQASEVIGKNPRVLKSMKHSEEFYKEMWHQLHTVGKWSDEIYNKRKNDEIYLERLSITAIKNEQDITTHYIAQFLDISDLKNAQDKAEYQADHDFLTGLINRKTLMSRLKEEFAKAKRHDFLHAFLFIDLDNFKTINDAYGHNIGDMLIIEVANRLKNNLREEDVICRLGGDEFAIMILNIDKTETKAAQDVKDICTNLLNSINEPFLLKGHKLNISSSIGVKLFPDNTKTIDDIIIHADTAMYQAKKLGKNQFVFFDAEIEMKMKNLLKQEKEIKSAFTNNEFEFYYQPKVDVSTGKIIGAEMLARWNHPTKGLLYPDSFIDISNNLGLIHNFTKIALKSASEFLYNYSNIFTGSLAINISSTELLHQNFEQEVIDFLKNNNIKPNHIEFEITETEIINNFELVIKKITKLQDIGINFSIDDFGTGYSSLTYLQKLPVNTLKIDREFFFELHLESSRELLRLMSNMAKTFNLNIVAEGIENKSQLDFIKEINVEQYQGFYMSKALKENQFINLLS